MNVGQATPAINESSPKDENGVHWVVMFDKNDERADILVTTLKQSLTARNYTVGEVVAVTEAETASSLNLISGFDDSKNFNDLFVGRKTNGLSKYHLPSTSSICNRSNLMLQVLASSVNNEFDSNDPKQRLVEKQVLFLDGHLFFWFRLANHCLLLRKPWRTNMLPSCMFWLF